jgi:hypothetical protein
MPDDGEVNALLRGFDGPAPDLTPRPSKADLHAQARSLGEAFVRAAASFPTNEDADFAIKNKFGYGLSGERQINNQDARVVGVNGIPEAVHWTPSGYVDWDKTPVTEADMSGQHKDWYVNDPHSLIANRMHDAMARAALAANRDPIAWLGFDPKRSVADIVSGDYDAAGNKHDPKEALLAGEFDRQIDQTYANRLNQSIPETLVHEAIHRGLQRLSDLRPEDFVKAINVPSATPPPSEDFLNTMDAVAGLLAYPSQQSAKGYLDSDENEMLVRQIMDTVMGSPQSHNDAQHGLPDLDQGYRGAYKDPGHLEILRRLQDLAADEIARKRPGGPR